MSELSQDAVARLIAPYLIEPDRKLRREVADHIATRIMALVRPENEVKAEALEERASKFRAEVDGSTVGPGGLVVLLALADQLEADAAALRDEP